MFMVLKFVEKFKNSSRILENVRNLKFLFIISWNIPFYVLYSEIQKMFVVPNFCLEYHEMFHFSNIFHKFKKCSHFHICFEFHNWFTNSKNLRGLNVCPTCSKIQKMVHVFQKQFLPFQFCCSHIRNMFRSLNLFINSKNVRTFKIHAIKEITL